MLTAAVSYFFRLNEANLNYGRKKFCRLSDLYKYWHENFYTCTVSLFFKNIFPDATKKTHTKSRKQIKKGFLNALNLSSATWPWLFILLPYQDTLQRWNKFFFAVFMLLLNLIEEVNRSQIFMGQKIRRL